ncbi:DUF6934 family protein [Dyadobacter jiangsuensis]|uniref:Uncharacterized protein n=1 Tax=Dyadobacter jiangsuensis TaxID=1591085 RepID=A0A2P8FSB4_9BACT|nr:hypothetical protein [Dyadobacter jiangsuensis]PSL24599.1 hypothetical protein CLV60_11323 [Dyadobacter jiangsuensis]
MDLEHYEIEKLDKRTYRFFSTGSKGKFEMRVKFTHVWKNTFNLGFGVLDPMTEILDDLIELRNGDSQKILATVANTVLIFLDLFPQVSVYATGSTRARTRLYQMGINRILPLLSNYTVTGYKSKISRCENVGEATFSRYGQWREIELGVEYDAFLICKE